jgi:hypothetical protein
VNKAGQTNLTIDKGRSRSSLKEKGKIELRELKISKGVKSQLNTQNNFGIINNDPIEPGLRSRVGSDYLLSSLKILRMSDNFLPPLMHTQSNKADKLERNIEDILVKRASTNDPGQYLNREIHSEDPPKIERNKLRSIKRNLSPGR